MCLLSYNLYISKSQKLGIMLKIETINLHNFSNKEHYRFMTDFSELVSTYPASILGMDVWYRVFQNTLMAEDLALRVEEGSAVAQTLEQLDQLRDKTWNAINMRVKATLLSPLEEEAQSAKVIERIIHRYGDVCSMTYNEESLALINLTNDLLMPVNDVHIDRVGFPIWVIELKRLNEQLHAIYNARNLEFAGRESDDVKAARTLIDPVYHQLIEKMNAYIVLEFAQPEVITFARKLNEKIKYYQTTFVSRDSRSMAEKEEEKKV